DGAMVLGLGCASCCAFLRRPMGLCTYTQSWGRERCLISTCPPAPPASIRASRRRNSAGPQRLALIYMNLLQPIRLRNSLLVLLFAISSGWTAPAKEISTSEIDVILWFDTEDYLLPADDDACKRLAEMLTERKIRATFKVVGEKARVLEKRGRRDVIDALKQHDIGYHANFHSVHPTPSEYLADCGWSDGITEFVRREGEGAR